MPGNFRLFVVQRSVKITDRRPQLKPLTVCLLDYDYIRNHYRLMAVDLNKQKELDAGTKAIQQIEFEKN